MAKRKTFPLASFKAIDDVEDGTFTALVAAFGNVDLINDRIVPGAFEKSLARWEESGDPIPVVWSHRWDDPQAHVGKVLEAEERDEGLWVKGQLDLDQPLAAQTFRLLKERRVKEFSFAYDVIDEARAKDGANELRELDLIEVGPTLKGMNPATQLLGVKAAVRTHHTDTSDAPWDGPANEARLPNDAGESTYRQAFAWQDPDADADTKAAWKFIHHEVSSDGEVGAANTTACTTAVGVLNGGRGGTNIPDSDREGVYNHLAAHLEDAGTEPPELKAAPVGGTKAMVSLAGSFEQHRAEVARAAQDWAFSMFGGDLYAVYPEATFDDHIIVYVETWDDPYGGGRYYQASYTRDDDGAIELGEAQEVAIEGTVVPKARRHGGRDKKDSSDGGGEAKPKANPEAGDGKGEEPGARSPLSARLEVELEALSAGVVLD